MKTDSSNFTLSSLSGSGISNQKPNGIISNASVMPITSPQAVADSKSNNDRNSLVKRVTEESRPRSEVIKAKYVKDQDNQNNQKKIDPETRIDNVIDRQISGLSQARFFLVNKIILASGVDNDKAKSLFEKTKLDADINNSLDVDVNNSQKAEQKMLAEMLKEVDEKIVKLQNIQGNQEVQDKILEQMRQAEARFIEESLEYQEKQKKQKDNSKTTPKAQNLTELFGGNSTIENSGLTYEIREIEVNDHATNQPSSNMQIVFVDPMIHYQQKVSEIGPDINSLEVSSAHQVPSTVISSARASQVGVQLGQSQAPSTAVSDTKVSSLARNNSLTTSTPDLSSRPSEANIGKPVLGPNTARVVSIESKNVSMGRG